MILARADLPLGIIKNVSRAIFSLVEQTRLLQIDWYFQKWFFQPHLQGHHPVPPLHAQKVGYSSTLPIYAVHFSNYKVSTNAQLISLFGQRCASFLWYEKVLLLLWENKWMDPPLSCLSSVQYIWFIMGEELLREPLLKYAQYITKKHSLKTKLGDGDI